MGSKIISKPAAALEVRVIPFSKEDREAITDALTRGKAAAIPKKKK